MYGLIEGIATILPLVLIIAFFISLLVISLLVNAAKEKGFHRNDAAVLWVIGIFASPIVLGLYTASLPDRGAPAATMPAASEDPRDELPAI